MLNVKEVNAKVSRLQTIYAQRDARMRDVLSVRQGDISKVYPAMFSEDYSKPLVANIIDVSARDLAEAMAPLPSFNCSATNMVSDSKTSDRVRVASVLTTITLLVSRDDTRLLEVVFLGILELLVDVELIGTRLIEVV